MSTKNIIQIAVPSNNGETIFPGMLGRAERFYIFRIENEKDFRLVEVRSNPFAETRQHLKTLDIYRIIRDCHIVVAQRIGKKGIERLKARGMALFFREGSIVAALKELVHEIKVPPDGVHQN